MTGLWYGRDEWEKKLSQRKEIPQFHTYRGEARYITVQGAEHWRNGEFEKAERVLREAIEVKDDYATAWYYLGEVFEKQKRWEEAKDVYRKSMQYCPHDSRAGNALFTILLEQKRGGEALEVGLQVINVHPEATLMWDYLAVVYLALGDSEKSLECDERARILLQGMYPSEPEKWYTQLRPSK